MTANLLDLAHDVRSAQDFLRDALVTAGELSVDDEGKLIPWPEIHDVCGRLEAARLVLEGALGPIAEAIAEEQRWHDDGADRAEATRG